MTNTKWLEDESNHGLEKREQKTNKQLFNIIYLNTFMHVRKR